MKARLQITVNKELLLKKIEECTDFYANEESVHLKNCLMTHWKDI